jgi:hypothetical protein
VFSYGSFSKKEYAQALRKTKAMIYLQTVESQGLALQEAWAHDVPTLVWNAGSFTYPRTSVTAIGPISAPYLTEQAGIFFGTAKELHLILPVFIKKVNESTFAPRDYCIKKLSNEASVRIYRDILNEAHML